jgi:hypothetical protein
LARPTPECDTSIDTASGYRKDWKTREPSLPFKAKVHLKSRADIAVYIEAMLEDAR